MTTSDKPGPEHPAPLDLRTEPFPHESTTPVGVAFAEKGTPRVFVTATLAVTAWPDAPRAKEYVRALIAAAPEMEALLLEAHRELNGIGIAAGKIRALLTRIDAAKGG